MSRILFLGLRFGATTTHECPAWDQERHLLISHVGRDLSPAAVIAAMLAEDRAWKAVVSFCETVLVKKEAAERDRERANPARRRQRPTDDLFLFLFMQFSKRYESACGG
ncbi:jg7697 [Pararge aegeria aegeria]|uniref:Jg7697 protein n=1 Tax=Pararge aegeria aegeria TaxID=348720 RepID=A0A8S4RZ35_9NEOP|nr:jg7697 [Pararge aegeria aegeria]